MLLPAKVTSVKFCYIPLRFLSLMFCTIHSSDRYKPVCTCNTCCVLARVLYNKAKKGALFLRQLITCSLIGLLIIAVHNFQRFSDRSSVSAFKLVFILKLDETQARRQRGGNAPPDFRFCPSIFFLPPTRYFFGRKKLVFFGGKNVKI